jgi:quinol monooxygenase YgiN
MSVTFILECKVHPDAVDDFLGRLQHTLPHTRAFEGCERLDVLRDQDEPATFVLVQRWASRDHQARYVAWRQTRGEVDSLDTLLERRSRRFLDDTLI